MGFNVNCNDCTYCGYEDGYYYCYHPRMIMFNNGELFFIEDIEQNIDCEWFEKDTCY